MYTVSGLVAAIERTSINTNPEIYKGDIKVFVCGKEQEYRVMESNGNMYIMVDEYHK